MSGHVSPYEWDCLVNFPTITGEETILISELPGDTITCGRCDITLQKPGFLAHMVAHHEWKVMKGSA